MVEVLAPARNDVTGHWSPPFGRATSLDESTPGPATALLSLTIGGTATCSTGLLASVLLHYLCLESKDEPNVSATRRE